MAELPASARRVADALAAAGVTTTIVVLEHPADAARAVGCAVGQIVKSLVFRLGESGRPLLVLTSGAHRVDEDLLAWDAIWAAGGHPHTVFRLTPAELLRVTGGRVVAVRAAAEGEASL